MIGSHLMEILYIHIQDDREGRQVVVTNLWCLRPDFRAEHCRVFAQLVLNCWFWCVGPQVQRMAAAGVADRPAAGRQRRQGDAGAAETSRSAAADQQEDGGRRTGYLHAVHRPQHSTGPGSALTLILKNVHTRLFARVLILLRLCRQIVKVLTLYTPVIEFEERVSHAFITTIKVSHGSGRFMFCLVLCLTLFSFFPPTFRTF